MTHYSTRRMAFLGVNLCIVSAATAFWLARADVALGPLTDKHIDAILNSSEDRLKLYIQLVLVSGQAIMMWRLFFSPRQRQADAAHNMISSEQFQDMQRANKEFIHASEYRFSTIEQHLTTCNNDRRLMIDLLNKLGARGPEGVRDSIEGLTEFLKEIESRINRRWDLTDAHLQHLTEMQRQTKP